MSLRPPPHVSKPDASLDDPRVWSVIALREMIAESVKAWRDDFAPSMGAAIAYYTAFSIAPLLVIVIAIAGLIFGNDSAQGHVYRQVAGVLGPEGSNAVRAMVESASATTESVVAIIIGSLLLVVGATTVFAELQSDLDRIWRVPALKTRRGIWALLRGRLLSLGLVVTIGFVMLISLVLSAALVALSEWWSAYFDGFEWLLLGLDFVVSIGIVSILFALMYKILPSAPIAWSDVFVGAFVASLLFAIGKVLVGLYVGKAAIASAFGAAGSLAVLLIWVYYSAQIFLLGAEFTWVFAHRLGSRRGTAPQGSSNVASAAG